MPKFSKNDLVFAKVKGYPSWPAVITDHILKNKKYEVKFYGTGETGLIKEEDLRYYLQSKDQLVGKAANMKRKDYLDALNEIETAFRIAKTDGGDTNVSDKTTAKVEKPELPRKVAPKRKINNETENNPTAKRIGNKRKTYTSETSEAKSDDIDTPSDDIPQEKPEVNLKEELQESIQEPEPVVVAEVSVKSRGARKKSERFSTEKEEELTKPNVTKAPKGKLKKNTNLKKSALDKIEPDEELEETVYTIIPVANLEILITYFENIKDKATFKKLAPQDLPAPSDKTRVVRAVVPKDATFLGIPYHEKRMPKFHSEFERASYEAKEARRVIQLKDDIQSGAKTVDEVSSFCIPLDGKSTEIERNVIFEDWLCQKQKKLQFLKIENKLLTHDCGVKTSLGLLDKADPDTALVHLQAIKLLPVEPLMLKKHPQVFEMAKRLQRYVGNVQEWNMDKEETDIFQEAAKRIRVEADQVFDKFYTLMLKALPDRDQINDTIFWTKYMEEVERFQKETSHLKETDVFIMSSEPSSRASILDSLCQDIVSGKSIYDIRSADADSSTTEAGFEKTCMVAPPSIDADSSTAEADARIDIIQTE